MTAREPQVMQLTGRTAVPIQCGDLVITVGLVNDDSAQMSLFRRGSHTRSIKLMVGESVTDDEMTITLRSVHPYASAGPVLPGGDLSTARLEVSDA